MAKRKNRTKFISGAGALSAGTSTVGGHGVVWPDIDIARGTPTSSGQLRGLKGRSLTAVTATSQDLAPALKRLTDK